MHYNIYNDPEGAFDLALTWNNTIQESHSFSMKMPGKITIPSNQFMHVIVNSKFRSENVAIATTLRHRHPARNTFHILFIEGARKCQMGPMKIVEMHIVTD
jgi:hypothetical protein